MKYHERPFLLNECKIELTYECPLACIHCSSDASPGNNIKIQKDKCFEIINQADNLGVKKISFSGGEPLLWDGVEEAITLTSNNGMNAIVYSSGNIPNKEDKMKALISSGTSKIVFSIFGSTDLSHERITRIKNSFSQTVDAVKVAHKTGLEAEFHFVPLSINYKELPRILKLAKSLEINTISILRFVPQGRGHLIRKFTLDRLQNIELKRIIEDSRNNGFNIRTGSPFNFLLLNNQPECASAIDRVIISPDLRIYPCDAFKQLQAEELVGSIEYSCLDQWTLQECWENSPFLEAIREYLTTDFEEPCNSCNQLELCLSGCLAQKVFKTKDLSKQPDPMCIINKTL